jgi:hypothetical protein
MSLGLFTSAFARTEFQAIQFLPAVVFHQLILCGLFVARDQMARLLQIVSDALPLTYAFDALQRAIVRGALGGHGRRPAAPAAQVPFQPMTRNATVRDVPPAGVAVS